MIVQIAYSIRQDFIPRYRFIRPLIQKLVMFVLDKYSKENKMFNKSQD